MENFQEKENKNDLKLILGLSWNIKLKKQKTVKHFIGKIAAINDKEVKINSLKLSESGKFCMALSHR